MDPKYSRWLYTDPALGEYIPQAGADTSKLPNGGAYNCFNFAVFGYANNNPVKYNDPTEEALALAVAIPAASKTVGAVAVSIGPVDWVVIGVTVVGVGVGIALYNHYANSADKENEQAKAVAKEEGNRSFGSITIQIQKGTKSIQKGSTRLALNEKGVSKQEAQDALCEHVDILSNTHGYGKTTKIKAFQEAVM